MPDPVTADAEVAKIPCSILVYRALLRSKWIDPDHNSILPDAYIPRANGQDDDGLSVVLAQSRIPEELIQGAEEVAASFKKTYGVATLHTGWVRNIDKKLDIIPDHLDEQPHHALLTGVPRQDQNPAETERLAGQLARISRLIIHRSAFIILAFQVGDEGLVHHVVDDLAGGVEGAGLFAGGGFGFGVVGGQQVFKDLAQELRVQGDLLFNRGVFGDGEFVAVQDIDQAAHLVAPVGGAVDLV